MDQTTKANGHMAWTSTAAGSYRRGVVLILLGSTCASWLGLGVRIMESATSWQILAYRSLGVIPFLLIVIAVRHPGRVAATFREGGRASIVATTNAEKRQYSGRKGQLFHGTLLRRSDLVIGPHSAGQARSTSLS